MNTIGAAVFYQFVSYLTFLIFFTFCLINKKKTGKTAAMIKIK